MQRSRQSVLFGDCVDWGEGEMHWHCWTQTQSMLRTCVTLWPGFKIVVVHCFVGTPAVVAARKLCAQVSGHTRHANTSRTRSGGRLFCVRSLWRTWRRRPQWYEVYAKCVCMWVWVSMLNGGVIVPTCSSAVRTVGDAEFSLCGRTLMQRKRTTSGRLCRQHVRSGCAVRMTSALLWVKWVRVCVCVLHNLVRHARVQR